MKFDFNETNNFLKLLDPRAPDFTFQTFDDSPQELKKLARVMHGSLEQNWDVLCDLNGQGAGVFVTVNRTDLKRRKKENIRSVRAVFADLDGAPIEPVRDFQLLPNIVVTSSTGRYHAYWLIADDFPLGEFATIQKSIAKKFNSDPTVHDLPRVLRLPGFCHKKTSTPFPVTFEVVREERYTAAQISEVFSTEQTTALPMDVVAVVDVVSPDTKILQGKRNSALLSIAGKFRAAGMLQDEIECALVAVNHSRCAPPLDADEVLTIARRYPNLAANDTDWGEPQAIPNTLPDVMPFNPDELLPSTLAPLAKDVAERMQCPVDYLGVALMVLCGSVIGSRIAVRPKSVDPWCEVPNLWGIIIGRSGEKKTPALSEVMQLLKPLQDQAYTDFSNGLMTYHLNKQLHDETLKNKKKKADKGDYTLTVEDMDEPQPPVERRYIVHDTTVEALGVILKDNPTGTLVSADEIVGLLSRLDGEEKRSDRSFYLEAYNGKSSFSVDRISRGRVIIPKLCVSIMGSTQPDAIKLYIRQTVLGGIGNDGLMQRFQLAVYPDRISNLKIVDRLPDVEARLIAEKVIKHLDRLDPVTLGCDLTTSTPSLGFDQTTQNMAIKLLEAMEAQIHDSTEHPALISHYSKYRKTIYTLALIIHLAEMRSGPIGIEALSKAFRWMTYLKSHAQRIYDYVSNGQMPAAQYLLNKIKQGKLTDGFTARDVARCKWAMLNEYNSVKEALLILEDFGWLRRMEDKSTGRPTTRYLIHPSIVKKVA